MFDGSVAVVGAGNVGCALATDLALRGVEVRLFNRSPGRLEAIRASGGLTVTGAVEGFSPIGMLTTSLAEAVRGADVVAVTVPTVALPEYARALIEATSDQQLIWLNPGHSGGALSLAAVERSIGRGSRTFCQLTTASHASRMTGPAEVRVFLLARAAAAAFPAGQLESCHAKLDALLPGQFGKAQNVLEADLANVNAILHPPGMVCNAGWIEATGGDFGFYADASTTAVGSVMDAIDRERLAIAARYEVPALAFPALFRQLGFAEREAADAHGAVHESALIHPMRSPPVLDHRYLHEDVGWGLVPWAHLAAAAQVPTPTITALTHLAGVINGVDYSRTGATLQNLGLANLSVDEIRSLVSS